MSILIICPIMPTEKQKKALDKMVENGGNVSSAMREVWYSPNTAKTPQKLTDSQWFQELCNERWLTDQFLIDCLVDDIKSKPWNRKWELELWVKIKWRIINKEEKKIDLYTPEEIKLMSTKEWVEYIKSN